MKGKFPVYNICVAYANISNIPSRELTYPTEREKETHLQNCLGKGYVSSQEGMYITYASWTLPKH